MRRMSASGRCSMLPKLEPNVFVVRHARPLRHHCDHRDFQHRLLHHRHRRDFRCRKFLAVPSKKPVPDQCLPQLIATATKDSGDNVEETVICPERSESATSVMVLLLPLLRHRRHHQLCRHHRLGRRYHYHLLAVPSKTPVPNQS